MASEEELEDVNALERALHRLDVAIQDDRVQLENTQRELRRFAQKEQDVAHRLEARQQSRVRIAGNLLNMYRAHARK